MTADRITEPAPDATAPNADDNGRAHPDSGERFGTPLGGRQDSRPDPLGDMSRFRLSQNFAATVGVRKALLTVPVRKPKRQEFVRVHPSDDYRTQVAVLELQDGSETYLVEPDLLPDVCSEVTHKALFTAITRQGVLFLWPIRLPDETGKLDDWNRSALDAADHATRNWVRVPSNRELGAYECWQSEGGMPDPEWPAMSFDGLLGVAFKGRMIETLDHPVLLSLRGAK